MSRMTEKSTWSMPCLIALRIIFVRQPYDWFEIELVLGTLLSSDQTESNGHKYSALLQALKMMLTSPQGKRRVTTIMQGHNIGIAKRTLRTGQELPKTSQPYKESLMGLLQIIEPFDWLAVISLALRVRKTSAMRLREKRKRERKQNSFAIYCAS